MSRLRFQGVPRARNRMDLKHAREKLSFLLLALCLFLAWPWQDARAALTITTASPLTTGTANRIYTRILTATGGAIPYAWSVAAGTLPTGLNLTSTGIISGTATIIGTSTFTLMVVDNNAQTCSKDFSLTINQSTPIITTSTLTTGTVGFAYSRTLTASGSVAPYTWALAAGSLPSGLNVSSSGYISGTPTAAGTANFTVQATDANAMSSTKAFSLAIVTSTPVITTSSLATGTTGFACNRSLTATGGIPPYTWSLAAGSLPEGVTLSSGGIISGTPAISGTAAFTARVSDSYAVYSDKALSLTIVTDTPVITSSVLLTGTTGDAYSQALTVTGGIPPYTWSIAAGALPGGVTLSSGGILSGTPAAAGTAGFTARVTDSWVVSSSQAFSLTILPATAPVITTSALATGTATLAYSQILTATGGKTPYAWSVAEGVLPAGLILSETGVISGTATSAGTASISIQVTGGNALSSTQTFNLTVTPGAPAITTTSPLPTGMTNVLYSQALAADNGTPPYAWSITAGTLPTGLSLSSGVITGTPSVTGTASFTVQVTGSNAMSSTKPFSLFILSSTPTITSSSPLPDGMLNTRYDQTLTATEGVPPYTWSVTAGSLPGGLNLSTGGVITGTPNTVGTASFTLQVTGSNAVSSTQGFALSIVTDTPTIATSTALPTGAVNVPYRYVLTATGGVSPYSWAVTDGSLPAGLNLNSSGIITGTPTATGTTSFTVQATGANAVSATKTFSLATAENAYYWGAFVGLMSGFSDGTGWRASFNTPRGLATDSAGNLYVADTSNHLIRKVTPAGVVTTLAGSPGSSGTLNGTGTAARFNAPRGIAVDGANNLYVADYSNHTIRKVTPEGVVTTLAGNPGVSGSADGTGAAAGFNNPVGVAVDGAGILYVTDYSNHTIRKVTPEGVVTTLAGSPGVAGSADGTGSAAGFYQPAGIALESSGNLVVADYSNQTLREVTPEGVASTLAGTAGTAGSADGIGNGAGFRGPYGVAVDGSGNIYVGDTSNQTIRKVSPMGEVATIGGTAGNIGTTDGVGSAARFVYPYGIAATSDGIVYVTDTLSSRIRRGARLGPPTITTTALKTGTARQAYSQTLTAINGAPLYIWNLVSGSLPEGLTLSAGGIISGTAATIGTSTFTVQVAGNALCTSATFTLDIDSNVPIITTTGLMTGTASVAYTQILTATRGMQPYSWTVESGSLPDGLNLSGSGVISGTPTIATGTGGTPVTIRVTGSDALFSSSAFTITVIPDTPTITTTSLQSGNVGVAYTQSLAAVNGVRPYTWSVAGGSLPSGLNLSGSGVISGTPTQTGTASFSVKVTGSNALFSTTALTLVVEPGAPTITSFSPLPTGTASLPYSYALTATGGMQPYSWVSISTLPSGLALSSDGVLSGTPANSGFYYLTIRVTGDNALVSTQTLQFNVILNVPTITTTSLVTGTVDLAYNQTLTATGGAPPYAWSIADGSLPAGLVLSSDGIISGTATVSGTASFTVRATGTNALSDTQSLSLVTVLNKPTITSTALATGSVGIPYSQTLTATGGVTPYKWSAFPTSADLPNGLSIDPDTGVLSGTPLEPGLKLFYVRVTGNNGLYAQIQLSISFVDNSYAWTTLAGTAGSSGSANGTGSAARFQNPYHLAVDRSGNIYVADTGNHTIRKVTPAGVVTTLAGNPGLNGSTNGTGSTARFYSPAGVTVDDGGTLYVADTSNHTIRKVTPAGVVTTLAGSPGASGTTDGTGSDARFYNPYDLAVNSDGTIYVSDTYNKTIRLITPTGVVTTLAGSAGSTGKSNGTGTGARFNFPYGLATDGAGTAYVADTNNSNIRKMTSLGEVTTRAGQGWGLYTDGTGTLSGFDHPRGLTVDSEGNVYVADSQNQTIRKITPEGVVTTIGGFPGSAGTSDGVGSEAKFSLPGGIAVDSNGILYVADSSNHRICKGTLIAAPAFTSPNPLPTGTINRAYNQILTATGGVVPYTWAVTSGTLPDGLTLSGAGNLSGTPTVSGTTAFTLRVTDSNVRSSTQTFELVIATGTPVITSTNLLTGTVGIVCNQLLTATGGEPPYSWSLPAGSLPDGLLLSSSGAIGGTPTVSGTSNFTIQVSGTDGISSTQAFAFVVAPGAPLITSPSGLMTGTVGFAYSQTLTATNGIKPYAWTVAAGSLPNGLLLSSSGIISGTPAATGTNAFSLQVAGGNSMSSTQTFNIAIVPGAPVITTTSLATAAVDDAYSQILTATDGVSPYTWAVTAGALPAGLTLNDSGIISGTATTTGTASFTVRATGANALSSTKTFSLVAAIRAPAITSGTLTTGTIGVAYNQILTATGGMLPYSWGVDSGSLPAGLTLSSSGVIAGTATTATTANVSIRVIGGNFMSSTKAFSLTITPPAPTITTTNLPAGTAGAAYGQILTATGGAIPYSWSVAAGTLPTGLGLSTSGVITGTPTLAGAATSFTVQVTGANALSSTKTFSFSVAENAYSWANFVGQPGSSGTTDSTGAAARFQYPYDAAADASGNLYVADYSGHTLRKVTAAGVVTTLAGSPGSSGSTDGTGSAARFYNPVGVAVDGAGNVYVADSSNHTIRKVTPEGAVTTLAGSPGVSGNADGTGSTARFKTPWDVTVDAAGNLFVTDRSNHTIRKMTPDGVVTTLAGSPGVSGNADGTGTEARFYWPSGITRDGAGQLFVTDYANHTIRKVTPDGVVTTLAGNPGVSGSTDGAGSAAKFYSPAGIAANGTGTLYVAEYGNYTIRKVTPDGIVTTLGGSPGIPGSADGIGAAARFNHPTGIAVDAAGVLYVADAYNYRISKGSPQLPVITTATLPTGTANQAYTQILTATGGSGAYGWSVANGSLPAGLVLSGSGIISGTATTTGTATFTAQVTDGNALTSTKAFSLTILPPVVALTLDSGPNRGVVIQLQPEAYGEPLVTATTLFTGSYEAGTLLHLTAPAEDGHGLVFDGWSGDTDHLDSAAAATATLTVPDHAVSLTALYKTPTYTLTVTDGSGSGSYAATTTVAVAAGTPPEGRSFSHWSGDTDHLASSTAASTSVTMPAHAVSVAAVFLAPTPTFSSCLVNTGSAQRSLLTDMSLGFSQPVTLASGAVTLTRRALGSDPAQAQTVTITPSADRKSFTLSFPGATGGSLPDGVYDLVISPGKVTGDDSQALAGETRTITFHRLFGDYDGNKTVNNADYFRFKNAFGTAAPNPAYLPQFDYDGNGTVNNADYFQFKKRFGTSLAY